MQETGDRRLALLTFGLLVAVYGLTCRGAIWSSDAAMRLGMAQHLLDSGRVGFPPELVPNLANHGGRAIWGLGHPLVLVPSVLAGRAVSSVTGDSRLARLVQEFGATFTNVLLGAAACALVAAVGSRLGYPRAVCLGAALLVGLGTPWWVYTQDAFYEPLQGLCLLGALWALLAHVERGRKAWAMLGGACLGMAIMTKISNAALVPPILLILLRHGGGAGGVRGWLRRTMGALGMVVAGLLPFVAAQMWADWSYFGTPFVAAGARHAKYALALEQPGLLRGSASLITDPEQGALWYTPLSVLALLWLGSLARRRFLLTLAVAGSLGVGFLVAAQASTVGLRGPCWGPRYLIPLVPLAGLLFLPAQDAVRRASRPLRGTAWGIVVIAILIQLLGTSVHYHRFYAEREQRNDSGQAAAGFPQDNCPLAMQPVYLYEVLRSMARGQPWRMEDPESLKGGRIRLADARSLNVLNYWWVLGYYQRLPLVVLVLPVAALLMLGVGCALMLARELRTTARQTR